MQSIKRKRMYTETEFSQKKRDFDREKKYYLTRIAIKTLRRT